MSEQTSNPKVDHDIETVDEISFLGDLLTDRKEQAAEARRRRSDFVFEAIHPADEAEWIDKGWELVKRGKRKARVRKLKPHFAILEDRVWNVFYRMGYKDLNASSFKLPFARSNGTHGAKQIDVFACDGETAIIVECKSKIERGRKSFQKDIGETVALQTYLRNSVHKHYATKPKIIWIYATTNVIWSESDIERARDASIHVITDNEISYFETFLKHMGPAGRYQILGEFLRGQKIPAMEGTKVPAIRGKLGNERFYAFVTSARNLLRISFVNHQALNHPDGRPAYQRMIHSKRIKEIGEFISEKGGFFPTNLLINFTKPPRFDLISNKENSDENIKFGWLTLPALYRSAWIIDGQHRLYGYSGLPEKFLDQSLFVLAFDHMNTFKEADLFITINHKQKSVPKALLVALLADLRMGDPDPKVALSALASAVVRKINLDKTSPFFQRFAQPDVPPGPSQNLTISEAMNGLNRSALLGRIVHGARVPAALSDENDEKTIERARQVLNGYFEELRLANPTRWEAGKSAYVCVNPGIRAHLMLIPEIISYIQHKKGLDFCELSTSEFVSQLIQIARPAFEFFRDASDEEIRDKFSRKFGEGGVREYLFNMCEQIAQVHPDFGSEDFKRYLKQIESSIIDEANSFTLKLSEDLTNCVITILKSRYGEKRAESGEPAFWEFGVTNRRVRDNAFKKQQADTSSRRKPKEAYLDIIDLKEIVETKENWDYFEPSFNIAMPSEKKGSKKYHTGWLARFSEIRNIAAHKNSMRTYTDEDLEFIDWLRSEVAPRIQKELEAA